MADLFISYSREDQEIARRFAEGLEREGFSVWWEQALADAKLVIVRFRFLSEVPT
jgi:TIR domain